MAEEYLFYTVEEIAAQFRVNRKTVIAWIRQGRLKTAIKTPGGGKWLVGKLEVDQMASSSASW